MAEKVELPELKGKITLDNNELKEKAEETEEILQDIEEQAKKLMPCYSARFCTSTQQDSVK